MERMKVICSSCSGIGITYTWEEVSKDEDYINSGISTLRKKETPCKACNGKGYIEYAVFSIDEAEAILKHCDLSKKEDTND